MGNGARECKWRHAPEAHGGFGEIWKSQLVELRTKHRTRRVDFQTFRGQTNLCATGAAGRQMEKLEQKECVSLSLYRRTFKLKGNKKFRTWTKKSEVVFVFRDSDVLCIYVMNILCTFHVSVSRVWYTVSVSCRSSLAQLPRLASMVCSTVSVCTVFGRLDIEWKFSNRLVTVLWSTVPSPLARQMFLVASTIQFELVKLKFLN